MASLSNLPITNPNSGDPLVEYTAAESSLKMQQISTILSQRIGSDWKRTVVYIVFFLLGIVFLILIGVSFDQYKNYISHIKALCMASIIGIICCTIWFTLKPYHDKTIYGVVPYPTNRQLIPPDSTQCGRSPTLCTSTQQCKQLCTNNNGQHSYECTTPGHPNVYYLGTRLNPTQSYCLPKKSASSIAECSTKNGKVVWTLLPDGTQGWQCQCLYPDIFGGPGCTQQLACIVPGMGNTVGLVDNLASGLNTSETNPYGSLKYARTAERTYMGQTSVGPSTYWSTWQSSNPPIGGIIPPQTPYDTYNVTMNGVSKEIPRFQCDCPDGTSTLDGDPFVCHRDVCLNGGSAGQPVSSTVAYFDQLKQKCHCSTSIGQTQMAKSNINGACYPVEELNCQIHPETSMCTYGWSIIGTAVSGGANRPLMVAMKNADGNKRYYFSDMYPYQNQRLQCLVDITDRTELNSIKSKFYDLTQNDTEHNNVLKFLKGILLAFPVKPYSSSFTLPTSSTQATDLEFINKLGSASKNSAYPAGSSLVCNSYYHKSGDAFEYCPNPLSKTGTNFVPICQDYNGQDICGGPGIGTCNLDLSQNRGYTCLCQQGSRFNGVNCAPCLTAGTTVVSSERDLCCNGSQHTTASIGIGAQDIIAGLTETNTQIYTCK